MELRNRHYYKRIGEKKVVHTGTLQNPTPEGWEYLGSTDHPEPKMAVVGFVGPDETGYTIVKNPFDI